jgi:hypothetical protein
MKMSIYPLIRVSPARIEQNMNHTVFGGVGRKQSASMGQFAKLVEPKAEIYAPVVEHRFKILLDIFGLIASAAAGQGDSLSLSRTSRGREQVRCANAITQSRCRALRCHAKRRMRISADATVANRCRLSRTTLKPPAKNWLPSSSSGSAGCQPRSSHRGQRDTARASQNILEKGQHPGPGRLVDPAVESLHLGSRRKKRLCSGWQVGRSNGYKIVVAELGGG